MLFSSFSIINDLSEYPLSSILELVIPILVTLGIAFYGFRKWKGEFIRQQRFKYAKDLLSKVNKVNRMIGLYRDPFLPIGEAIKALRDESQEIPENEIERDHRGNAAAYRQRWKRLVIAYDAMINEKLTTEIVLDENLKQIFDKLDQCIRSMKATTETYTRNEELIARDLTPIVDEAMARTNQEIMYPKYGKNPGEESEFDRRIIESVEEIKEHLSDYIKLK